MNDEMIADLQDHYGLICRQITPVTGGWLNQKWKVSTDAGDLLVKRFSARRYDRKRLEAVEAALLRQVFAHEHGVPCPSVWRLGGRAIRLMDDDTAYVVMAFCAGKMGTPATVTAAMMRSLGDACGRVHAVFARLPAQSVPGFPLDDNRAVDLLWANFEARARDFPSDAPIAYRDAVLAMEPILKRLTPSFFAGIPKGIAHEDFSGDNMLFDGDRLSAIVDFDRSQYGYLWHDVGRAILSLALLEDRLDVSKVRAFVEGYAPHRALTLEDIAHALRLTWCLETPWWIQPEFFAENSEKVLRFRDEMLWLTARWFEMDEIVSG